MCVFAQQAICHSSISVDLQKKTTKDQILVCNTFICSSANKEEEEEEDRARGGEGWMDEKVGGREEEEWRFQGLLGSWMEGWTVARRGGLNT